MYSYLLCPVTEILVVSNVDLSFPCFLFFVSRSAHLCLHLRFQALVEKLNLGQENWSNFALFEIMEDGFGE